MATLTAGEKARMYALGKIMRGGASRGGYVSSAVYITIDGVQVGWGATPHRVLLDTLTITDELDETPNTCGFRLNGLVPTAGAEVIITLGSKNRPGRLFAGVALTVQQLYVGDKPANVQADVRCVDYTWQLGFLTVTRQYRNQSASVIAADLVSKYAAANGFTATAAIAPNLPVLDELTYTNEPLDAALTRLARRIGGYWFVDYQKAVHLFLEDTDNAPVDLTPAHKSLRAFQKSADRTQVLTRVEVEGRGSAVLAPVAVGATIIPLAAVDMFAVGSNVFAKVSPVGSGGGAQHLTFAGVTPGGGGSLVGTSAAPSGWMTCTAVAGGAVTAGPHAYAYTWVSALGETVSSPGASITITSSAPTAPAPGVAVTVGTGLPPGTYAYAVSHVLASGETAPTPAPTAAVCTRWLGTSIGAPGLRAWPSLSTNLGAIGQVMEARLAYRSTTGLSPATIGPTSAPATLVASTTGQPSGLEVSFNISLPYSANYLDVQVRNVTTGGAWGTVQTYSNVGGGGISAGCYVGVVTPTTAATETGGLDTASVTVTVQAGGADVTSRRLYRTKVNGSQKYFLRTVSGSTASAFVDTAADTTLVTVAPAGSGALQSVTLKGIAPGPKGIGGGQATTARKLYRTTAALTWKFLATIADNTTTTYTDTVADAALTGTGPPATDTSGLVGDTGQVLAGATTIPVSGTAPFPDTGGWVLAGNNRIRYTGVDTAALTLTGIPAAGDGSILNTIPYGTPITLAPMLTGVVGITSPIVAGDELYLVVVRDDAARQTALATMLHGGTGLREEWVQDRRLSITEAWARADATLAMRPLEDVTISYVCRDLRTVAGKTITVNLPPPTNVFGTYKIQSVTINNFRPYPTQYPTFTVTASSRRFNFEDWLRRMETSV